MKWNFTNFHKKPELIPQYQVILEETAPNLYDPEGDSTGDIQRQIDHQWLLITEWLKYGLKNSCGRSGRFRHHEGMFWTPDLKAQSAELNDKIN
jgi:hypothetical protein